MYLVFRKLQTIFFFFVSAKSPPTSTRLLCPEDPVVEEVTGPLLQKTPTRYWRDKRELRLPEPKCRSLTSHDIVSDDKRIMISSSKY